MGNKEKKKKRAGDDVDVVPPARRFKRELRPKRLNFRPASRVIDGLKDVTLTVTPTTNQFAALTDNSDEIIVDKQEPKVRVPPITVFDITRTAVLTALKELEITDFSCKPLQRGFQIFCKSIADYNKVNDELKKGKINFYTHDLPSNKQFRVVLLGLYKMEVTELEAELKTFNITPESIRLMEPKKSRYNEHCNYTLYFKKGEVQLSTLREIKALFKVIVRWEPYRSNRQGPTQCARCMRPGHGARHCHMPERCEYCAENHLSSNCPAIIELKNDPKTTAAATSSQGAPTEINVKLPSKCCNCGVSGHFASDPNCPRKLKYAEKRSRLSTTNRFQRPHVANLNDLAMFPAPPTRGQPRTPEIRQSAKLRPNVSYADSLRYAPSPNTFNVNYATDNVKQRKNEEPFTPDELISLTSDIFTQLRNVQSAPREEIVMAVMRISLKYLYKDDK